MYERCASIIITIMIMIITEKLEKIIEIYTKKNEIFSIHDSC